ncbi:PAS domain S-box protein [Methanoregula sp.]|uniref:PAS domain-containing response regulator n=1 Tax=Methanoregula sp. TaxID=2052170 RepID=UPI003562D60C
MIRVLYIDDESNLLEICKLFLEQSGQICVDTLTMATEAQERLKTSTYDAIISDYQMPVMDGISLLKTLRSRGDSTPFILFTGRGREEVVIEALNNGADFYIQKGGDPEAQFAELEHKIRLVVEQRRMKTELAQSQRRMADIIDFLPDATFAIDRTGTVIAWNRAMEELTGVPKDKILGTGNYSYALPFYRERHPILIDLIFRENPDIEKNYRHVQKKGGKIIVDTFVPTFNEGKGAYLWGIASSLYDTNDNIIGAIESIRDITDRKKIESALSESEYLYRTLFESTGTAMFILEGDTTISLVNAEFEKMSGYTKEEVEGKMLWTKLVVPEDVVWMMDYHVRRRQPGASGIPNNYEFRFVDKGNNVLDMFLSIVLLSNGKQTIVSLVNISERKRLEETLRQSTRKLNRLQTA